LISIEPDREKMGISSRDRDRRQRALAQRGQVDPPFANESTRPDDAERRQLTVMFCDLVGSTALSARLDPEDMREVIRAYRAACASIMPTYDGLISRFLGDGILAFFGYPRAHEDDAERAVRAALDIVAEVGCLETFAGEPLRVRIGIATGVVVVGDLTSGNALETQSVIGDTPNLAARLQTLAEPNTIMIADATRRLLGNLFKFRDHGAQTVKGLSEPVQAWSIEGILSSQSRFESVRGGRSMTYVGRRKELRLALARQRLAWQGHGQMVLISGDAGIGKSRFAAAIAEKIALKPYRRLGYQCSPYHSNSSLYPVIAQLERAARIRSEDTAGQKLTKLQSTLALDTTELPRVMPLFAALLSIPTGEQYPPIGLSPAQQRQKTFVALLDQIERLASRRPLLVVFEDIQWADATSLELFDLTVNRIKTLPILVLVTFRPEFEPPWSPRANVSMLKLERLECHDARMMICELTKGRQLPRRLTDQIVAKTDGIPLFVEELTKTILESGPVYQEEIAYPREGPLPLLAIPMTLQDSLTARLDRLGSGKEIARIAAVIGREFSYELLAAVSGQTTADLQSALAELTAAELIYCTAAAPEVEYMFKHALVQDAAYCALLKSRRKILHGEVANTIVQRFPELAATQPAVLAHHWAGAGEIARAVDAWQRAGTAATERRAFPEAESSYRCALDLLLGTPASPRRDSLELAFRSALIGILQITHGYSAPVTVGATAAARRLAESSGNLVDLMIQLSGTWAMLSSAGDFIAASGLADQLVDVALQVSTVEAMANAHMVQMTSRYRLGDIQGAEASFERGRRFYTAPNFVARPGAVPQLLGNASQVAWILGRTNTARERMNEALALARTGASAYDLAFAEYMAAMLAVLLREPDEAQKRATASIKCSDVHGFPQFAAIARVALGRSMAELGRPEDGIRLIEQGMASMAGTGSRVAITLYMAWLAEAYALAGAFEAAFETAARALEVNPEERFFLPECLRIRGDLGICLGRQEQGEADLREALRYATEMGAACYQLRAATSMASHLRADGQRDSARGLLAPITFALRDTGESRDLGEAIVLLETLVS
jgi:class 3 adenylate cyclase/tetratricopeptide (TPR) repeat protein